MSTPGDPVRDAQSQTRRILCDDECVTHCPIRCGFNDDGHEYGTWIVLRPSQHGEEPKVMADDFQSHDAAARWIDKNPDTHPYLPYCQEIS